MGGSTSVIQILSLKSKIKIIKHFRNHWEKRSNLTLNMFILARIYHHCLLKREDEAPGLYKRSLIGVLVCRIQMISGPPSTFIQTKVENEALWIRDFNWIGTERRGQYGNPGPYPTTTQASGGRLELPCGLNGPGIAWDSGIIETYCHPPNGDGTWPSNDEGGPAEF